jgi:hypothetical protein
MAPTPKKPAPRSVDGGAKTESTGNVGKPKPGQKRYSSGAPARGTQTRKDILADMQRLVKYVKTGKFKNYSEKKKVWAQIDNYRVALGTLKEDKRKSKSNATGVTTYDGGSVKVRKEAGFSRRWPMAAGSLLSRRASQAVLSHVQFMFKLVSLWTMLHLTQLIQRSQSELQPRSIRTRL